jgi:hypothetical protein
MSIEESNPNIRVISLKAKEEKPIIEGVNEIRNEVKDDILVFPNNVQGHSMHFRRMP